MGLLETDPTGRGPESCCSLHLKQVLKPRPAEADDFRQAPCGQRRAVFPFHQFEHAANSMVRRREQKGSSRGFGREFTHV